MNTKHLSFAKQKFGTLTNGAGLSLFEHSVRVALQVERWGYKGNVVTAALFHDLLEDVGPIDEEILAVSNLEVLNMVRELTIDTGKPFSKMSRAEMRKAVAPLKLYSEGAQVIKYADSKDNVEMSFFTYSLNNKDFYRWWFLLLSEYIKVFRTWYLNRGILFNRIAELKQFISIVKKV